MAYSIGYRQIVRNDAEARFGDPSRGAKKYIDENYPLSKGNLLANFIERASGLLSNNGKLGAIVSRTCFYLKSFADFRNGILQDELTVQTFADLGHGVLDAMVETAAFVCEKSSEANEKSIFFRHLTSTEKRDDLKASIDAFRRNAPNRYTFEVNIKQFSLFPDSPYIYWIDESVASKISSYKTIVMEWTPTTLNGNEVPK